MRIREKSIIAKLITLRYNVNKVLKYLVKIPDCAHATALHLVREIASNRHNDGSNVVN